MTPAFYSLQSNSLICLVEFLGDEVFIYPSVASIRCRVRSTQPDRWRDDLTRGLLRPPPPKPELDELLAQFTRPPS